MRLDKISKRRELGLSLGGIPALRSQEKKPETRERVWRRRSVREVKWKNRIW